MPKRIYSTVSDKGYDELEARRKEKGHHNVQDVVREIVMAWYEQRKQEKKENNNAL